MGRKRVHPVTYKYCSKCLKVTERAWAKDRKHGGCVPCRKRWRDANKEALNRKAKERRSLNRKPTLKELGLIPLKPSTRNPKGIFSVYQAQFTSRIDDEVFYKVGVSIDVPKRLREMGGSHYTVTFLAKVDFTSKQEALRFEAAFHNAHASVYTPKKVFGGSKTECYLQPRGLYEFKEELEGGLNGYA
ncbi:TPA: hypothetical protein NJ626_000256 [Vibrio parahaemolyticus]|nr:hypothetical protein [Vibrio parahaemolyticus]